MKPIITISSLPIQFEQTHITADFPFVFVRDETYWHTVAWADILYLKSDEHCVHVMTEGKMYTILASLTACEKNLPSALFRRVHRSYIINLSKIDKLSKTEVIINSQVIPLARTYVDALFRDFVKVRSLG